MSGLLVTVAARARAIGFVETLAEVLGLRLDPGDTHGQDAAPTLLADPAELA